ncbi:MAG: hypothetical protein ACTSYJ_12080 [Candidatus Thorarchaeota archaeon]
MKHVNNKMILGLVIASAFILGSIVTPVAALQVNMVEESFNYAFAPGDNNHTYIYVPSDDPLWRPSSSMSYFNESTDLTTYQYSNQGWSSSGSSYSEDTTSLFEWQPYDTFSSGNLGNPSMLPVFFDFVGNDGSEVVVNTTLERRSFSLGFGQHTSVAMDGDYIYYGTLAISGQEFVHLTVACLQDGFTWTFSVLDPDGHRMGSKSASGGDIVILPFLPSTAGTYTIILQANTLNGEMALFDFFPEAIAPRLIAPGEILTDTLPTGEIVSLEGTDSWVHDELVPTIRTYKVDPGTDVSRILYTFNYPIPLFMWSQMPEIIFTSDVLLYGSSEGYRYSDYTAFPEYGEYNLGGEIHYVTVMGGDNVDYSLYHEADVATPLIVNKEFKVDNLFGHDETKVYTLIVTEDSVIKVNDTSTSDFAINAWATFDDDYRYYFGMADSTSLGGSPHYYLPAGDYIFEVTVEPYVSEWIEFTTAPLTTDTSAGIMNVGGFIVPTDPGRQYNFTVTLDNLYNVSVPMDVNVKDQFNDNRWTDFFTLGTWFDGSSQIPHSSHPSTDEFTIGTRIYSEDYAIILFSTFPYNNTAGVGDYFENFPVNVTIEWEDVTHDTFEGTASLDVSSSAADHNFTLSIPGDGIEQYSLNLNVTPGTWYNVTIGTGDVNNLNSVVSYAPYNERTHYTNWGDLSDALQGSIPDLSIQFGAISDQMYLKFTVDRTLSTEGYLWIEITPMDTYELEAPPPLAPVGPDIFGMLGGIAVPLGIGVVVIVVVVVVYVKKFKK